MVTFLCVFVYFGVYTHMHDCLHACVYIAHRSCTHVCIHIPPPSPLQVLSWVLSYDGIHPTEPLAITAASAALLLSDIPFTKAVAGVRVGLLPDGDGSGTFVVNPTVDQMAVSRLDLMLAGTADAVLMIEGFCDFLTEQQMLEVLWGGVEWYMHATHFFKFTYCIQQSSPLQNDTLLSSRRQHVCFESVSL